MMKGRSKERLAIVRGGASSANVFNGVNIEACHGTGVDLAYAYNTVFKDGTSEGNLGTGVRCTGAVVIATGGKQRARMPRMASERNHRRQRLIGLFRPIFLRASPKWHHS